jgi:hypothetical protein
MTSPASLHELRPAQIDSTERRTTAVNKEPCRRGSCQRFLEQNGFTKSEPKVLSSASGQVLRLELIHTRLYSRAVRHAVREASMVSLGLTAMHA